MYKDCSNKLVQKGIVRDCITMCIDICTINIRVSIRVRGLHLVLSAMDHLTNLVYTQFSRKVHTHHL